MPLCVFEGVFPVSVYSICVSSHTLSIHNDIRGSGGVGGGGSSKGTLVLANSPSSHFYPPPTPPLPPSIRSLVPCQLVGRSRCEGGFGQEKRRERKRQIEIHIPLVTDFHCPRPFGQAFRHLHTNNYAHQTMESL